MKLLKVLNLASRRRGRFELERTDDHRGCNNRRIFTSDESCVYVGSRIVAIPETLGSLDRSSANASFLRHELALAPLRRYRVKEIREGEGLIRRAFPLIWASALDQTAGGNTTSWEGTRGPSLRDIWRGTR